MITDKVLTCDIVIMVNEVGQGETCFISQQNLNASNTPDLLTYANSSFKRLKSFETGLLSFYCFESAHLERAAQDG